MKVGILVHGRHVDAIGWDALMWGEPPEKLGSLTRMILEVLERGPENIGLIVFGTGASEKDGLKEAEYMKQTLLGNMRRLEEFTAIKTHERFKSRRDMVLLDELIKRIVCETKSQNTPQEVANAAKLFASSSCGHVYQISCGSHLPRCINETLKVRAQGGIPSGQYWYGVADDMVYAGSTIGDVVIVEPPHRGDDPMRNAPVKLHEVIPYFFKLSLSKRMKAIKEVKSLLLRYRRQG